MRGGKFDNNGGRVKILVGCEMSGRVREAFAAKGHIVWSCDLEPTEIPGNHYQGDIFDILYDGWDMLIAFPPCTHLAASGAVYWPQKQDGRQQDSIAFVLGLWNADIPHIAIENPSGILSTVWKIPTQIIEPYFFGDPYRKRTCLWLKRLPALAPSSRVEPIASWHSGSTRGGKKKDGTRTVSKLPSLHSGSKKRSLTFQGVANAMADQWGGDFEYQAGLF